MSLYRTELRRLFKRRFTRLMLVLLVLALGGIVTTLAMTSEKIGPAQLAAAEAQADRNYQTQLSVYEQQVVGCETAKARGQDISQDFPPDCGRSTPPLREDQQAKWFLPYQFEFRAQFELFISAFAGILALFAFLVAASYVGAEWSTGGMTNLLLWRPRRLAVLGTKLAAALTGLLAVGVLFGALWTAAFWLVGRYDGVTGRMTSGVWTSFAISGARGLGLVLAVGAIAFGLASLGRHTAMALGAAVAVGVVSEVGLRIVTQVAGIRFGERYVLSSYALAWFQKKWTLVDWESCNSSLTGECQQDQFVITWQHSALVFGLGTVLVVGAALWAMRRRDVT